MAWLCWHYHVGPRAFDGCTDAEYLALHRYANQQIKAQNRAARRAAR